MVEDHAPDVFLVQKALRENQVAFELTRFEDGEQAMLAIQKRGPVEFGKPDLIILDLNLPKVWTSYAKFGKTPAWPKCP